MRLRRLALVIGFCLIEQPSRAENPPDAVTASAEEFVLPSPEFSRPYEELAIPSTEFATTSPALGSPLTLMQWSYGDGADSDNIFGPIETDRPYFTKTATVVGRGEWQLETGVSYGRDPNTRRNLVSFPEALLRIGAFAEWFEFRLGWNWVDKAYAKRWRVYDATFPSAGLKIALTPQDDILPEMAIVLDVELPSKEFQSTLSLDDMQPTVDIIYRWDLGNAYKMGGATQFSRMANQQSPYLLFAQSWIVERSLTDALTGYAEWYMLAPDAPKAHVQHYFDTGLLFLLADNIQLDTSGGVGLNNAAFDYFVGAGCSIRW